MMHSFKLSRHRLARVWLDEAPEINFSASSTAIYTLCPKVRLEASHVSAVVELYIPQGPTASYALLGAEFREFDSQDFEVFASVASGGIRYLASLASKYDEVCVGLPEEYVGAVFKGVERMAKTIGAPRKVALHFKWAAHSRVGSSPWIFERISGLVFQLLVSPRGITEQEIETVLDSM